MTDQTKITKITAKQAHALYQDRNILAFENERNTINNLQVNEYIAVKRNNKVLTPAYVARWYDSAKKLGIKIKTFKTKGNKVLVIQRVA